MVQQNRNVVYPFDGHQLGLLVPHGARLPQLFNLKNRSFFERTMSIHLGTLRHATKFECWISCIAVNVYRDELDRRQAQKRAAGPHVGLEELMAYRQGAVADGRRREIQRHLVVCSACLGEFREGLAFFGARAEAPAVGPAVGARVWEACWQRVQREDGPVAVAPPLERVRWGPSRRMPFALVASVVVALGMGVWGGWLEWENRELVEQVQRGTEQWKGVEGHDLEG
jgi:hypothetical protein